MNNERTTALFDLLEAQARLGLSEIASLRQRVATLEAENQRLREALDSWKEAAPVAEKPAMPSQGSESLPRQAPTRATAPVPDKAAEANVSEPAETDMPRPAPATPVPPPADELPSPQALLNEWYRRYTDTFFKGHTRPLKVGIHEDLLAREPWPEKLVRRALACYVHLPRYLKAVRAGTERVDLDGQPAGTVNDEEASHARQKLEGLQARQRDQEKRRKDKAEAKRHARLDQKLGELLSKHGGRQ